MAHRVRGGTDRRACSVVIGEHDLLHPVEQLQEARRQKMRPQLGYHVKVTNACRELALCSCSESSSAVAKVSRCVHVSRVEKMGCVEHLRRRHGWQTSRVTASQNVSIGAELV